MPTELETLTATFRALGARDPERSAKRQLEDGEPELARFLFLSQAWRWVVEEDDHSWIDREIQSAEGEPTEPMAGIGLALARLRALGAADEDLTDVVRGMQATLLFQVCNLLGDPGLAAAQHGVFWALLQLSEEGEPLQEIDGLQMRVLETDPTGREVRPRGVAAPEGEGESGEAP